jgi:hypothetical protein
MKHALQLTIFAALIAAIFAACTPSEDASTKSSPGSTGALSLKVTNWGPEAAQVGTVPNKQPDGSMGIWIQVESTQGLGEAQVLFGGQAGKSTNIGDKLITTAIAPELLNKPGTMAVTVKQVSTGNTYPVGTFVVNQ